ncbi:MAG TPA: glycerol-3-phosphate 1-O-acyltransferase PlsY [Lacunisphaera sp.]|jgi:glycerol-3-phosphate acyltransferase PlsY|nr:glycerol-3-phosphate 1-O-acyltransferase PlsY [Lacunisphaera sp.]
MLSAWPIGSLVIGYLLGSLPFGYLVARAHGVDIFKEGSGNPGATNVKRVLGEKFGAKGKQAGNLVFALDALKGALAAGWPMLPFIDPPDERMLGLVGVIAAVLGHSFSVFTRFKGGKGVATAAGGLVVLIPVSCLIGAVVWLLTFLGTRYVSLGSILAAIAVPLSSWLRGNPLPLNVVATALGLFVIFRHRENIRRLLNGTESKFARKPAA